MKQLILSLLFYVDLLELRYKTYDREMQLEDCLILRQALTLEGKLYRLLMLVVMTSSINPDVEVMHVFVNNRPSLIVVPILLEGEEVLSLLKHSSRRILVELVQRLKKLWLELVQVTNVTLRSKTLREHGKLQLTGSMNQLTSLRLLDYLLLA
jgi:hypothetical protein